jgi:hypothetical protein
MGSFLSITQKVEPFNQTLNPERPPLSGREALEALMFAEQIDQYRKQVSESPPNLAARLNQDYMPARYSIPRTIVPSKNWPNGQVLWLDESADGGLPHTRPPYFICLPINIPDDKLATTLEHERIHLSQRANPEKWQTVFKAWNMKPWSALSDDIPLEILQRRRLNPDLLNIPMYIWKNEWVVFALFRSMKPSNLSDVDIVWWNAPSRTLHRDAPPGWKEFFGDIKAGEHPYEIAAYLLADFAELKNNSPAYRALVD